MNDDTAAEKQKKKKKKRLLPVRFFGLTTKLTVLRFREVELCEVELCEAGPKEFAALRWVN